MPPCTRNFLHRDVSAGNILIIKCPRKPMKKKGYELTQNRRCTGMIINGDHAVEGREGSQTNELSGTIPYMSIRRLEGWHDNRPLIPYILDDMESAFWVMLLEYVCIANSKGVVTTKWPSFHQSYSESKRDVLDAKEWVSMGLESTNAKPTFYLGTFKDLLKIMWSKTWITAGPDLPDRGKVVKAFWKEVIEEANKKHPEWDSWTSFFEHVTPPPPDEMYPREDPASEPESEDSASEPESE
ncbi:hypothetical protein BDN72DRAFT_816220 [Pluteus cervinus]|uniref:Uncharacterized protein n=1 Tax=Pluteus cervinus TaxID=181527 RepID=A0ACD3B406_9AGAR|nr:hypothetical protein BDN72DRAFT_816220 [Pluteus cervinus]